MKPLHSLSLALLSAVAAWRYIDYQMKSGKPVEDVNFSGPGVAAVFRW